MWGSWGNDWGSNNWGQQDNRPVHKPDVCKLYVNKLPGSATLESITALFSAYGAVKAVDFKTDASGQSKRFCFVSYEDVSGAKAALANVATMIIDGSVLDIKSCGPNGDVNGGQTTDPTTLFAGGLPWEVTESDLQTYFSQFGTVTSVKLKATPEGKPKGFCFVSFEDEAVAKSCLEYTEHTLNGQKVDVKAAVHGIGKFSHEKGKGKGMSGKGKGKGGKDGGKGMMMAMMQQMMGGGNGWGSNYGSWGKGGGKGKGRYTPY